MGVYIKQIRLKNFQSWKDLTINLSDGFNVIRSDDNSAGKSVVMKAIKVTLCPNIFSNSERKKLIRDFTEYAEALFLYSDGTITMTRVLPNSTLHYYHDKNGWRQQQGLPFPETVEKIGGIVDYNTNLIANLLDSDQPLLLINSNDKTNHSLIELITHHEELNKIIPIFKEKYSSFNDKRVEFNFVVKQLEKQVESAQYVNIDKMQKDIDKADVLIDFLDDIINCYKLVDNSINFVKDIKDYDLMLDILDFTAEVSKLNNIEINSVKEFDENIVEDLEFIKSIIDLNNLLDYDIKPEVDEHVIDCASLALDLSECNNLLNYKILDNDILDMLECLSNIHLAVSNIQEDYKSDIIGIRTDLINSHKILSSILNDLSSLDKSNFEIAQIEQELKIKGAGASCPIYGNITIKDNKCFNMNLQ